MFEKTIACAACGERLPHNARFCGVCGFRLIPITLPAAAAVCASTAPPAPLPPKSGPRSDAAHADTILNLRMQPPLANPPTHRSGKPQRLYRRFPMRVDITYYSAHNFVTGRAENISSGGMFIATPDPCEVGELLEVQFTLPGLGAPCIVRCEVAWLRRWGEEGTPAPGMGLRFCDLDPQVRLAIDAFLTHREPIVLDRA